MADLSWSFRAGAATYSSRSFVTLGGVCGVQAAIRLTLLER